MIQGSQPQGSYFFIITFQDGPSSPFIHTFHGTFTPAPGMTRQDVFLKIRDDHKGRVPPLWSAESKVTFFSLEPNRLE